MGTGTGPLWARLATRWRSRENEMLNRMEGEATSVSRTSWKPVGGAPRGESRPHQGMCEVSTGRVASRVT